MQPCPNITFLVLPVLQLPHTCFFTVVSKTGSLKYHPEPARREGRWLRWFSSFLIVCPGRKEVVSKTNKKVKSENKRKIRYNPTILLHRTNSDGHKIERIRSNHGYLEHVANGPLFSVGFPKHATQPRRHMKKSKKSDYKTQKPSIWGRGGEPSPIKAKRQTDGWRVDLCHKDHRLKTLISNM